MSTSSSTPTRVSKPHISKTEEIDVTFGAFHIGPYRVPYMSTILRLQQVSEYLKLVTDDPKYARQDWQITELFQREINQSRVFKIVDTYLDPKAATKPPFFNSLTVVLNYGDDNDTEFVAPEPMSSDFPLKLPIGPVLIQFQSPAGKNKYPANGTFGKLSWNRDQVYAVAIDGQHRLAALKELYKKDPSLGSSTDISVLFLVIDSQMGFLTKGHDLPRMQWMRSIFIDLNKHAEPVSRARQLLLDDNDPTSRFVRELFTSCLDYQQTAATNASGLPIGKRGEFCSRLPLDLVDWHSESKSKVDEGPYVTSILSLDWIVRKALLETSRREDPGKIDLSLLSPDDDSYYTDIEKQLSPWKQSWDKSIKADFEKSKELGAPFILQQPHLNALCDEFHSMWGIPVTRLLTGVGPYLTLSRKRIESSTISPQFGQWYQASAIDQENLKQLPGVRDYYKTRKEMVENELTKHGHSIPKYKKAVKDIEEGIKKDSIFFLLVTQRSLFLALAGLVKTRNFSIWATHAGIKLKDFQNCKNDFYALLLSEAINALYNAKDGLTLFRKDCQVVRPAGSPLNDKVSKGFWAGAVVDRAYLDKVDFGEAGARRAAKWFLFMTYLYWFLRLNPSWRNTANLIASLAKQADLAKYRFGAELTQAYEGLAEAQDSPAKFLVSLLGIEKEIEEATLPALEERITYLMDLLLKSPEVVFPKRK